MDWNKHINRVNEDRVVRIVRNKPPDGRPLGRPKTVNNWMKKIYYITKFV